tara:strand:- start:52 stop:1203 length:1152 start_codon:yes stop_codon:yes gene_type:complete
MIKKFILLAFSIILLACKGSGVINKAGVEDVLSTTKPYGWVDVKNTKTQIPLSVKPLIDIWLRDTYITLGPDGYYYMTGTSALKGRTTARDINSGIPLWRSLDLKNWEDLGYVWTFEKDGTWQKEFDIITHGSKEDLNQNIIGKKRRTLWAPEIHYIQSQKNYFIVACIPENPNGKGSFILKSTSGKPEGPYINIEGNSSGPIFPRIDGSLFEDQDGTVYFVGHNHEIAKMKGDMSGFAEPLRKIKEKEYNSEPYIEGAFIVKEAGKYFLMQAIWSIRQPDGSFSYDGKNPYKNKQEREANLYSYDVVIASADNIYGPYSKRYTVVTGGGHNNFFKDKDGKWWSPMFGNPRGDLMERPFLTRAAIVPIKFENGKFTVDKKRKL